MIRRTKKTTKNLFPVKNWKLEVRLEELKSTVDNQFKLYTKDKKVKSKRGIEKRGERAKDPIMKKTSLINEGKGGALKV